MKELRVEKLARYLTHNFYALGRVAQASGALIVQFRGKYRYGGLGNPDARYMRGVILQGCETWEPWNLIVDLSRLSYEWGGRDNACVESTEHKFHGAGCRPRMLASSGHTVV